MAFEANAIISDILPSVNAINAIIDIGTNTVINHVFSLAPMFYLGVSMSGFARVGNVFGAGASNVWQDGRTSWIA